MLTYYMDLVSFAFFVLAYVVLLYEMIIRESLDGISGKCQIIFFIAHASMTVNAFYRNLDIWEILKSSSLLVLILIVIFFIYYHRPSDLKHDQFRKEEFSALITAIIMIVIMNTRMHELIHLFAVYTEAVALLPQLLFIQSACKIDNKIIRFCIFQFCYKSLQFASYFVNSRADFHMVAGIFNIAFCIFVLMQCFENFRCFDYEDDESSGIEVQSQTTGSASMTRRASTRNSRKRSGRSTTI